MADMNRRNVLLGLGTAAAGSGIVFGSGAFTQLEADRDVTISVEDDGSAQVGLTEGGVDTEAVDTDAGTDDNEIAIDQSDINAGAQVRLGEGDFGTQLETEESGVIEVANDTNANQEIEVDIEIANSGGDFDSFELYSEDDEATDDGQSIDETLTDNTESFEFAIEYELDDDLSEDPELDAELTINAEQTE